MKFLAQSSRWEFDFRPRIQSAGSRLVSPHQRYGFYYCRYYYYYYYYDDDDDDDDNGDGDKINIKDPVFTLDTMAQMNRRQFILILPM